MGIIGMYEISGDDNIGKMGTKVETFCNGKEAF